MDDVERGGGRGELLTDGARHGAPDVHAAAGQVARRRRAAVHLVLRVQQKHHVLSVRPCHSTQDTVV